MGKKKFNATIAGLAVIAALDSVALSTDAYILYKENNKYQDLKKDCSYELVIDDSISNDTEEDNNSLTLTPTASPVPTYGPALDNTKVVEAIDLAELKKINPDVCGWINIEGTNIDYPICYSFDNKNYLKHDVYGNENKSGVLFLDYRNAMLDSDDLSDLSIVYGHCFASSSKTMFTDLLKYKKQSYYDEHPYGIIYTGDSEYCYKVNFFAGYILSSEDGQKLTDEKLYVKDFEDEKAFNNYFKKILANSTYQSEITPKYGDKIIALVTCSYETDDSRYVQYGNIEKMLIKDLKQEKGR